MHLKAWFIFQMEKHCFWRPLLGSCQSPWLPFSRKLLCLWGWREKPLGVFLSLGGSETKDGWHIPGRGQSLTVISRSVSLSSLGQERSHSTRCRTTYRARISDPGNCRPVATCWSDATGSRNHGSACGFPLEILAQITKLCWCPGGLEVSVILQLPLLSMLKSKLSYPQMCLNM